MDGPGTPLTMDRTSNSTVSPAAATTTVGDVSVAHADHAFAATLERDSVESAPGFAVHVNVTCNDPGVASRAVGGTVAAYPKANRSAPQPSHTRSLARSVNTGGPYVSRPHDPQNG